MERSSAGAWKIQQRAVGRHKQRRSDSSALASCLQKESKHGRTAGALFSDPPGNGGDGLPGALRLTACYDLLRATKKLASSKLRASASNSRIFWLTRIVTRHYSSRAALTAARRSRTKRLYSRRRDSSSGCRSSEDGLTVARIFGANFDENTLPRQRVTGNERPKIACAAV